MPCRVRKTLVNEQRGGMDECFLRDEPAQDELKHTPMPMTPLFPGGPGAPSKPCKES